MKVGLSVSLPLSSQLSALSSPVPSESLFWRLGEWDDWEKESLVRRSL